MLIKCDYCDEEFHRKPSHVKRNKNNFCSRECSDKWKIGKEHKHLQKRFKHNCHHCDKEIEVPNHKYQKYLNGEFKDLFCDKNCHDAWQKGRILNNSNRNRVEKKCQFCGEEYTTTQDKKDTSKYCSRQCLADAKSKAAKIEVTCDYCSKSFTKNKSKVNNQNFCDRECMSKWNSEFNNNQVEIICWTCNKEFKVARSREETAKTCSRKCHNIWLSDYYFQTEEGKQHLSNNGIKATLNQKYSETKPERIFKEFLIHNNIEFMSQHLMYDKFVVDFYLPKMNMVIEVFGDYWHGNPHFYGDLDGLKPLTKKQIKQKKKDKARQAYLEKCGHEFHILWEDDIYNKLQEITKFLLN